MKRIIFLIVGIVFVILFLPLINVHAAEMPGISFMACGGKAAVSLWSKTDSEKYLFLPSGADPDALRLSLPSGSITYKGLEYRDGDLIALTAGEEAVNTITMRGETYHVVVLQSQNIPSVHITIPDKVMNAVLSIKDRAGAGTVVFLDGEGKMCNEAELAKIRVHGNSTRNFEKKSFNIKLGSKEDLYNMGISRTWILLSCVRDSSLIRDALAFEMAKQAGMPYVPDFCHVDLFIGSDYLGTYLLCENITIGSSRIDIEDLEKSTEDMNEGDLSGFETIDRYDIVKGKGKFYSIPSEPGDLTGGYLLEMALAGLRNDKSGYCTLRGLPIIIKSPEYVSEFQYDYISALIQSAENAIFSADGIDPDSEKHYTEIIDQPSAALKYLLEEFCKNYDANGSSQFLYKPEDSVSTLIYFGPAWDYDLSLGNISVNSSDIYTNPEGLAVGVDKKKSFYLYPALYKHEDFIKEAAGIWYDDFAPAVRAVLGMEASVGVTTLDEYIEMLSASAAMNRIINRFTYSSPVIKKIGGDFIDNAEYLRAFMSERLSWLDTFWMKQKSGI